VTQELLHYGPHSDRQGVGAVRRQDDPAFLRAHTLTGFISRVHQADRGSFQHEQLLRIFGWGNQPGNDVNRNGAPDVAELQAHDLRGRVRQLQGRPLPVLSGVTSIRDTVSIVRL